MFVNNSRHMGSIPKLTPVHTNTPDAANSGKGNTSATNTDGANTASSNSTQPAATQPGTASATSANTGTTPSQGGASGKPNTAKPGQPQVGKPGNGHPGAHGKGTLDFTHMSLKQFQAALNYMIHSGQIAPQDASTLIRLVPAALAKMKYDGNSPPPYSQPTNILGILGQKLVSSASHHDSNTVGSLTRALAALQSLQGTAQGVNTHA